MILDRTIRVTEVLRTTQAMLFSEVAVGDVLRFSVILIAGNGYQPQVKVENLTQGTSRKDRMTIIAKSLPIFAMEELGIHE
ncbi:MAG: hypothetical protein LC650_02770 [Actinobacteria bacterium]|nr:hypothetical protein [Actinomycetota bacterium]